MTPQEIIDRAYELFQSGNTTQCFYRDAYGCKCVVGHFLPDETLDQIDKAGAGHATVWRISEEVELPQFMKENLSLFRRLQRINDTGTFDRLSLVVEHFGLEDPSLYPIQEHYGITNREAKELLEQLDDQS
jgi:hypothetical protein